MIFSIRIKTTAAEELKRVVKPDRRRIVAAIDRLAENPFLGYALKGDMRGLRRLRVGDYRVVYEVREDVLVVLVVRVAHRRDEYRRRPGRNLTFEISCSAFSRGLGVCAVEMIVARKRGIEAGFSRF